MYGQEQNKREQILEEYTADVERLLKYLPWMMNKQAKDVSSFYEGDAEHKLVKIPVYDSTLLAFVKEAEKTKLVNKYYPYTYTRYKIKTVEDEKNLIEKATLFDIDLLKGILSKYVLLGKTKSVVWSDAVGNGIFVAILAKLDRVFHTNGN